MTKGKFLTQKGAIKQLLFALGIYPTLTNSNRFLIKDHEHSI